MSIKDIGIMVGYILVVLCFFYFIGLAFNTQSIVEGLQNQKDYIPPEKLVELYEENNEYLKDQINLQKYQTAYQDALVQMHENINLAILQTLINSKDSHPNDKDMDHIQKLRQYREAILETESFLDEVNA